MPKSFTARAAGELLRACFAAWPEASRTQVRAWLKSRAITVNGRPTAQFDHPLAPGDVVAVRRERFADSPATLGSGLKILFEDAHLLVVDKPANLLSIASASEPERTAYWLLTDYVRRGNPRSRERVWIVHRLDRGTSGLMIFAKTAAAKETLQARWDEVEKRYAAVVEGRLSAPAGVFDCHLDESNPFKVFRAKPGPATRRAVTRYRELARARGRSLVELTLETGRRHQIRVQLADAGCPIVGDERYGARSDPAGRLGLHAGALRFFHPATREEHRFASPLPRELARLVPREESDF